MATDSVAIIRAVFPASAQKYALGTDTGSRRIQAELKTGFIEQYSGSNPADCAQAGHPTSSGLTAISQISKASSIAVSTGSIPVLMSLAAGLQAIPVVGNILGGAIAIFGKIFGGIFAHHAQAVAREQGTLCALIPQVNKTLSDTDAAVQSGDLSVMEANAQLEQMVQAFDQDTASITHDCNAGCVMQAVVRAEATIHEQKYRNSPLYYLKHYWWIGAIALVVYLLAGRR